MKFGEYPSKKYNGISIHILYDLLWLKREGIWDKYVKDSGHVHDLEDEIKYLKGNFYGWVAMYNSEAIGFVLATPTDFDMCPTLLATSMWIDPKYRASNVDKLFFETMEMWSSINGLECLAVMSDDIRIAKWIARRYKPDGFYILQTRKVLRRQK